MKRDHDEEFDQDQDVIQDGFEVNDAQENNDSNELNYSENSGNHQTEQMSSASEGNTAKRQKRNDDEEVRLLIPSKVSYRFLFSAFLKSRIYDLRYLFIYLYLICNYSLLAQ